MAEDTGDAEKVVGVVPSLYYDLIARILAGAPVVVLVMVNMPECKLPLEGMSEGAGALLVLSVLAIWLVCW